MLSGAMLRENFKFENLTAQGVDLEALYAGLSLPSGFYQWEITAFLADQRQVSNVGMAMMTVYKNNPPQITFPQNKAVLMNTGFQSINFTWMPRHRYSTNAAAGTIYTFKIYEIPTDENEETDPNVIVNSGVLPLFSTQTFGTNYTYKPSDPLLVPGRRYVIQVQAADINGNDEFENNGLSEVSTFSFGNPSEAPAMKLCKKPSNFLAEKLDEQSVQLTWQETNSETPIDYLVNYKTENDAIWTEKIVADPALILVQLAPAHYKFKVYARCTYDNKSAFTNEMSVILESPKPEETPEAEPQDTYVNTDPEPVSPSEYEPEQTKEPAINVFNTPIKIILDSEELKNLPDSLQLPKGYEKLGSLPVLSDKPSIEDLKAALQTQKIDCASYLAGYSCGQHDAPAVPSGDIIQVKTGDEIAINSVGFEVVELDGSGNGKGIVKISMFNNAKFGVEFKGIKVAKGGCVVSGEAILSNVDVALLSEEQRKKLAETYAAFNKALDVADKYAAEIAETYNSLADFTKKVKTDVTNYVGSVKEAKKMKSHFKAAEKYAELILKNPNISDSTRKKLQEAYNYALETKEFFCNGKPCVEARQNDKKGGGPSVISEIVLSLCEENKQKLVSMTDIMDKANLELEKIENRNFVYESDGHYWTVFMIGLQIGLDEKLAQEIAKFAELPDTEIDGYSATLTNTWSKRKEQIKTHALTAGSQVIEELSTAVKILNTDPRNIKELGRLIHRYGDSYAHSNLEDGEVMYGKKIKITIYDHMLTPYEFEFDYTAEHAFAHSTTGEKVGVTPDKIGLRPELYLKYVKELSTIMGIVFEKNTDNIDMTTFKKLANYAKQKTKNDVDFSLRGIFNYEVSKKIGNKTFYIPFEQGEDLLSLIVQNKSLHEKHISDTIYYLLNYEKISKQNIKIRKKYSKKGEIFYDSMGGQYGESSKYLGTEFEIK
jgi:hypothetical protein